MMPSIINTLLMTAPTLLVAVPLGVFAAIYLVEYAKNGSRLIAVVRVMAETLTGIPSIVYGLFGMLFFVGYCKGLLTFIRCYDPGDHGIAGYYADNGRGIDGSSQIIP